MSESAFIAALQDEMEGLADDILMALVQRIVTARDAGTGLILDESEVYILANRVEAAMEATSDVN